jgi:hypothetical protein
MAELDVGGGVLVRTPDDVEVRVVQGNVARRGIRRGSSSAIPGTDALKSALSSSAFTIAAEVEIAPTRPGARALVATPCLQPRSKCAWAPLKARSCCSKVLEGSRRGATRCRRLLVRRFGAAARRPSSSRFRPAPRLALFEEVRARAAGAVSFSTGSPTS